MAQPPVMARTIEEASVPTRVISSHRSNTNHNNTTSAEHPSTADMMNTDHHAQDDHHETNNHHFENNHNSHSFQVTIRLDSHEEELFETLLQVADLWEKQQHDDTGVAIPSSLQLRVAGGWVRDKILGLPRANDVDITTDLISGVEFATLVQQHYHDHHAHPDMTCSSKIGIIAANPDQSKHLETATMRFHFDHPQQHHQHDDDTLTSNNDHNININNGEEDEHQNKEEHIVLDVDFCQLRSQEVYEADSRIPTVTIGTAWEDAQRRDFTMNALFWNLRTRQVEDWTRRGLVDLLHAKKLETPIAPDVTLVEDPLRALRAVRFAVRFDMTLDPALRLAVQKPDLHHALERKISRERVGKELEGMLTGKDAKQIQALELLIDLELASSVFCWVAPNFTSPAPSPSPFATAAGNNDNHLMRFEGTLLCQAFDVDERTLPTLAPLQRQAWEESRALLKLIPSLLSTYQKAQEQLRHAITASSSTPSSNTTITTKLDSRLFYLAVYLLPFRHITVDALVKKKRVQRPLVAYFIHESIKFKNKDVQGITSIMEDVAAMLQLLDEVVDASTTARIETNPSNPSAAARLCRAKAGLILRATKELWVTCLWVAMALKLRSEPMNTSSSSPTNVNWLKVGLEAYRMIMVDLHLDQVWKLKPLLDGDAVIRALSLPRGPLVGKYLEEQVMWMLLNPQGSREECQDHLLSVKRRMLGEAGVDDDANNADTPMIGANRQPSERHISKKFHGDSDPATTL